MGQPSKPVIRNVEYIRSQNKLHGEAFDDVKKLIGNLQDSLADALSRLAALEKGS